MTNDKILKLAIDIAIKNGFKEVSQFVSDTQNWEKAIRDGRFFMVIFSHDFAKAFWGEGQADEQYNVMDKYWHDTSCCSGGGCFFQGRRWQYHLQQMVLEEDPIKYLEQYV